MTCKIKLDNRVADFIHSTLLPFTSKSVAAMLPVSKKVGSFVRSVLRE